MGSNLQLPITADAAIIRRPAFGFFAPHRLGRLLQRLRPTDFMIHSAGLRRRLFDGQN
jgi:hypothetical protein